MDLQQLRTFTMIAREGSLVRASESLFLSQPAVSAQLKALEEQLGLRLFDRSARGMQLTQAGQDLLDDARRVLSAASDVVENARRMRDGELSGECRIGTISNPERLRLGELFARLLSTYPRLKVSITQAISGTVIEQVLDGTLAGGYVIGEPEDARIGRFQLEPMTLRVVAPAQWKTRIETDSWENITALPWISTPDACSFRRISARMFAKHGVHPQTVVEADRESTLAVLVKQGIGLALLRESTALTGEASGEFAIWPPGIETDYLYYVYPLADGHAPLVQSLVGLVRSIWDV